MSKDQLRIGIVGTGFVGRVHARSARLAGAILAGVAASSPERAAQAASRLGADQAFTSWEDLLDSPAIDVVHVCTPNWLHLPVAEAALAAGKHVVCEKPLAADTAQAARLVGAAESARKVATVPFVYRFYPTVREARARVARGELGPLRLLHGSYLQDWLSDASDSNWRVDARLGGASRAFADIGSHWCDLVEFVSGHRIRRLAARLATLIPERPAPIHRETFRAGVAGPPRRVETEDVSLVSFETDREAVGSLVVSQVSPGRKNRLWFELDGSDAAVAFDQEQPETLWLGSRKGWAILPRDPEVLSPEAAFYATLPAGHPQGYADCFDAFVADTYRAIGGEDVDGLPGFPDGLRAARLTEAVLRASNSGAWEDVAA